MQFNAHPKLKGKHSFLSPSKYHWVNYDEDKLASVFGTQLNAMRGTQLHEYASTAIRLRMKQARSTKTVNAFVNDCLSFRMSSEVPLYYSDNSFGTADALGFRMDASTGFFILRIFDLKTGTTVTSLKQLYVYAALFCLEYEHRPEDIMMEFRIYQNDDVQIERDTDPEKIRDIMKKIVRFDGIINDMIDEAFE